MPDGPSGDTKYLVRLNSDGSFDPTFSTGFSNLVLDVDVSRNGDISAVGGFDHVDGLPRTGFAKLDATGAVYADFNPTLSSGVSNPNVLSVKVLRDQRVVIGGNFIEVNGVEQKYLAMVSEIGELDSNFIPDLSRFIVIDGGGTASPETTSIIEQPDKKLLVTGSLGGPGGLAKYLIRIDELGAFDPDFIDGDLDFPVLDAWLDNNGDLLIGGGFSAVGAHASGPLALIETGIDLDPLCMAIIAANGRVVNICI